MRFFAMLGKSVEFLANIATLLGLAVAVYAFYNPATVSEYLADVAANTERSAESLAAIEGSSAATEQNTRVIADDIPYWIELSSISKFESGKMYLGLTNNSRFEFADLRISLIDDAGNITLDKSSIFVAPREGISFNEKPQTLHQKPTIFCLSAVNGANDVRYFEERRINSTEGWNFVFGSREFGIAPTQNCAAVGH